MSIDKSTAGASAEMPCLAIRESNEVYSECGGMLAARRNTKQTSNGCALLGRVDIDEQ